MTKRARPRMRPTTGNRNGSAQIAMQRLWHDLRRVPDTRHTPRRAAPRDALLQALLAQETSQ